jgi:hypothetical protein
MIKIQEIKIPANCVVNEHEFYTYDPLNSFARLNSLKYLNEDLFQCYFPKDDIIVDLGWYGDVIANIGEFKIHVIKNEYWDNPVKVFNSKSIDEIKDLLVKIIAFYSGL